MKNTNMANERPMAWQIDLVGESPDIAELKKLAPHCGCSIDAGLDGRQCLSGVKFEALSSSEEVRAQATEVLVLLNGLARLKYGDHRPVRLGLAVSRVHSDGRRDVAVGVLGAGTRARASPLEIKVTRADGTTETPVSTDKDTERAKRIVGDPQLIEVVKAFSGDINWQKLRVAFEKISALVGKGKDNDNALVKLRFATQEEISRFKANVEDPRLSGLNAVHAVSRGKLRGTPMSEQDGLAFVIRLLNAYVDRALTIGD
jgi:hypothetical protein